MNQNMRRIGQELLADAEAIVSAVSGCDIHSSSAVEHGIMTFKALVETRDSRAFIVRFYPQGRESVVNCEPDLLARLRAAGVPVPIVVTDSRVGPKAGLPYVAYRMIPGRMLSEMLPRFDNQQRHRAAQELTDCLLELGAIDFTGYGELVSGDRAASPTWSSFVRQSFDVGLDAIRKHSLCTADVIRSLDVIAERLPDHGTTPDPLLVWGDFNFDNVIVNEVGNVVGLIDFESCLSGDPLATLGYCLAFHWDQPFSTELLSCWTNRLGPFDRNSLLFYAVLRAVRLAPYAHRPLPTGYPRDPLTVIFPGLLKAVAELRSHLSRGGG